jgi:hypothetical protein
MVKLLTDIEQLCTIHVPHWLRTPRMDARKIAQFYDDPVKRSCDAKALHAAEYRRRVSTKATLRWHTHRLRLGMMERLNALRDAPYRSTSEDDPEHAQQPQPTIGVAR